MLRKYFIVSILFATVFIILTGCAGGNNSGSNAISTPSKETAAKKEEEKPVKITVWSIWKDYPSQKDWEEIWVKSAQAKYPNITLELKQGVKLEDLVVAGEVPDISIASVIDFWTQGDLGLLEDMTPLIKKYNFDLNRIQPSMIKQVQSFSEKGEIYGIPHFINFNALYYNKDIFDKFGVPYPKDMMMWEDVVELAKKVTRSEGDIQYMGLDPENINRIGWQLGVGFADPKTEKSAIQQWKPAYELLQQIISIPGNRPKGQIKQWTSDPFIKDRYAAMFGSTNQLTNLIQAEKNGLNWDMVTYPQSPYKKGTFGLAGGRALLISKTSKNQDAAFKVIDTIVSDEVQKQFSRAGLLSSLKAKAVQDEFAKGIPDLQGKNTQAIFKLEPGWYPVTKYDIYINSIPFQYSLKLYDNSIDINTLLMQAEEEGNKIIETKKTQGK